MLVSVLLGLALVGAIVFIGYLAKHHPTTTATDPKAMLATVTAGLEGQFDTLREDFGNQLSNLPALVSAEVAKLRTDLAGALQRAATAEAQIVADRQAHDAALAAVAARVAAAVTASPELPPAPVVDPAAP